MQISIKGAKYKQCVEASQHRWSKEKGNYKYARGLINSEGDSCFAERVGLLGETAFGLLIKQKPDFEYRKGGDKTDFKYKGLKIDVKTMSKKPPMNYNLLIRACEGSSTKGSKLKSDIYVQAYLEEENRKKGYAVIGFIGFVWAKDIDVTTLCKSRRWNSSHKNYEYPFEKMAPIEKLEEEICLKAKTG